MSTNPAPCEPAETAVPPRTESENIKRARKILREGPPATLDELKQLGKRLKGEKEFGWARQIFGLARRIARASEPPAEDALQRELRQQHALCTYKDQDLTADFRLRVALEILDDREDLSTTTDPETLGIAGAIYKSKWQLTGQREHLERSLAYYDRGYRQGVQRDRGYTAINAAFVLNLLAHLEEEAAFPDPSPSAAARRKQARRIREEIIVALDAPSFAKERADKEFDKQWWFVATLAEACFGLGRFDDAFVYLKSPVARSSAQEWELESTARQLIALSDLLDKPADESSDQDFELVALKTVANGFGLSDHAMRALAIGKIGMAFSGGGFRASLFHLGVLAKLAELDLLRHVDVFSCVSGGSIVGAHYYLELRHLLRSKPDAQITAGDYIQLVRRMVYDFLAGVQTNIRTRLLTNLWHNLRMMFTHFSRTRRAAELYERRLYSRIPDGEGDAPRYLNRLTIQPYCDPRNPFKPKNHNWNRAAKVPILVLNATTLNSGHNWQFTATWMGEPPSGTGTHIDRNFRLRRLWYDRDDTPADYRDVRLGDAVGASACVPGVFAPVVLRNLYQHGITARLVDGGVHDNQGTSSLLDQDCTVLLVSDASGQMNSQPNPGQSALPVVLRAKSILETRVRGAQFKELDVRQQNGLLQDFMFIHLKEDLDVEQIDWIGTSDPSRLKTVNAPVQRLATSYGILKNVQASLAAIRTDLDSFTDTEAYALMCSGYCMTDAFLPLRIRELSSSYTPQDWEFLKLLPAISDASHSEAESVFKQLCVSCRLAFKAWRLVRWLRFTAKALAIAALALLLVLLVMVFRSYAPVRWLLTGVVLIALPLVLATLGFLVVWLHLVTGDKLFLRFGRR